MQEGRRGIFLVVVSVFLLTGCLPGIVVSRQAPTDRGITIDLRLGNTVETEEWLAFQKQVCASIPAATEGFPEGIRDDIFRYTCTEPSRHDLGKTLAKLTPDQMSAFCGRLSEKGFIVKKDMYPTAAAEISIVTILSIAAYAIFLAP